MPSAISSVRHCILPRRRSPPGPIGELRSPWRTSSERSAAKVPSSSASSTNRAHRNFRSLRPLQGRSIFWTFPDGPPTTPMPILIIWRRCMRPIRFLNGSQFWYHAEFFDTPRLQNLFTELVRSGSAFNFNNLFGSAPGNPPVLTDPALICYYLFYPAHEESLSGCEYAPGQIVDTARDFASFAGEWTCIALLLDRPNATSPYVPKWAGLTNRNVGKTSVKGEEVRSTMRLLPWGAMDLYQVTHPRFFVGRGSHGLYLPGETTPPLSFADPSAAFCGGATSLTT